MHKSNNEFYPFDFYISMFYVSVNGKYYELFKNKRYDIELQG